MSEMTQAEVARALKRLEDEHKTLVTQAVYDRDMHEIRDDIHEIKDSLRWTTRFIAGLFVTVLLELVFFIFQNTPT